MSFLFSAGAVDVIPDSGLQHHYDWSEASSADTISDQAGSDDLTATGGPTLGGDINGIQAGRLDGANDYYRTQFSSSVGQPVQTFFVARLRSVDTSNNQGLIDGFNNRHLVYDDGSGDWRINYGLSGVNDGAADTNNHIFETDADGTNSALLLDGSSIASGDAGSDSMDGLTVGALNDISDFGPLDIGELAVYDPTASGYSASDVRQYLSNKWGIALS